MQRYAATSTYRQELSPAAPNCWTFVGEPKRDTTDLYTHRPLVRVTASCTSVKHHHELEGDAVTVVVTVSLDIGIAVMGFVSAR